MFFFAFLRRMEFVRLLGKQLLMSTKKENRHLLEGQAAGQ
jgi:hypothetical protein